ncbi:MAG: HD domain-containing protein [Burkholderiales bacterium]|nr:HD domain-containing protein [Burkholderiales bacterium]
MSGESKELRILMLEDTSTDAELIEHAMRRGGISFSSLRVETREAFSMALDEYRPDIILSDYKLPSFDGMTALQMARDAHPEIPVIMVTGALSDIEAVDLIQAGAKDYVLKDRLARLPPAIRRVLSAEQGVRARKEAENALRESYRQVKLARDEWNSAFDAVKDPLFFHDRSGSITRCNRAYVEQAGLPFREIIGKPYWEIFPKGEGPLASCGSVLGNFLETADEEILAEGGRTFISRSFSARDADGEYLFSVHIMEDITERKKSDAEILRVNRLMKTLSEANRSLLHAADEADLMRRMCEVITGSGRYMRAWIGLAKEDGRIDPVAVSGDLGKPVESVNLSWKEQGLGPAGMAVRTCRTQIAISDVPGFEAWKIPAAEFGCQSCIALPLQENGKVFGVLNICSAESSVMTPDEVALLEEMAGDLTFGIVNLRTRSERDRAVVERQEYAERLRSSLEDALQAIAYTVEMRDPYTAGHQRRVANLAAKIASMLGLPEDQVHGIRLAGIVHDLGKILVPAEILSRPGKLSEIEFGLIKVHPQAGYDILKGIDFPWPIAQAVLQHHERLDGSGYPAGFRDGAIILEARILTVADVVEAMSSHRPYRPGRGIGVALAEIRENRGRLYDPQIVDACLELFEMGYVLPSV